MRVNDESLDLQVRLENINHIKRQRQFYLLSVMRPLFGEWSCLGFGAHWCDWRAEQENQL